MNPCFISPQGHLLGLNHQTLFKKLLMKNVRLGSLDFRATSLHSPTRCMSKKADAWLVSNSASHIICHSSEVFAAKLHPRC